MSLRKSSLAWVLLAALCAPAGAVAVFGAGGEGLIHGVIYRSDEATRLAGALVTAINVSTGRRYSSVHTGANGAYEIKGLPAGTYDIAIDTPDDNLYVTDGLIELHENQRLLLSLSLKKNGGAVPGSPSPGDAGHSYDPGTVPFQPASTGPAPAVEDAAAPADEDSGKKGSGKKSSKDAAAPQETKPPKKPKKPAGNKANTGSGATASLRVEPAPALTPA